MNNQISSKIVKQQSKKSIKISTPSLFCSIIVLAIKTFILSALSIIPYAIIKIATTQDNVLTKLNVNLDISNVSTVIEQIPEIALKIVPIVWFALFALGIVNSLIKFNIQVYNAVNIKKRIVNDSRSQNSGTYFKLFMLEIVKCIIIAIGTALLIVPGVLLAYSYRMSEYFIYENQNLSIIKSLKLSRQMMRGNKLKLFLLDLSFIGWNILISVPFLFIWIIPYIKSTYILYYDEITKENNPVLEFEDYEDNEEEVEVQVPNKNRINDKIQMIKMRDMKIEEKPSELSKEESDRINNDFEDEIENIKKLIVENFSSMQETMDNKTKSPLEDEYIDDACEKVVVDRADIVNKSTEIDGIKHFGLFKGFGKKNKQIQDETLKVTEDNNQKPENTIIENVVEENTTENQENEIQKEYEAGHTIVNNSRPKFLDLQIGQTEETSVEDKPVMISYPAPIVKKDVETLKDKQNNDGDKNIEKIELVPPVIEEIKTNDNDDNSDVADIPDIIKQFTVSDSQNDTVVKEEEKNNTKNDIIPEMNKQDDNDYDVPEVIKQFEYIPDEKEITNESVKTEKTITDNDTSDFLYKVNKMIIADNENDEFIVDEKSNKESNNDIKDDLIITNSDIDDVDELKTNNEQISIINDDANTDNSFKTNKELVVDYDEENGFTNNKNDEPAIKINNSDKETEIINEQIIVNNNNVNNNNDNDTDTDNAFIIDYDDKNEQPTIENSFIDNENIKSSSEKVDDNLESVEVPKKDDIVTVKELIKKDDVVIIDDSNNFNANNKSIFIDSTTVIDTPYKPKAIDDKKVNSDVKFVINDYKKDINDDKKDEKFTKSENDTYTEEEVKQAVLVDNNTDSDEDESEAQNGRITLKVQKKRGKALDNIVPVTKSMNDRTLNIDLLNDDENKSVDDIIGSYSRITKHITEKFNSHNRTNLITEEDIIDTEGMSEKDKKKYLFSLLKNNNSIIDEEEVGNVKPKKEQINEEIAFENLNNDVLDYDDSEEEKKAVEYQNRKFNYIESHRNKWNTPKEEKETKIEKNDIKQEKSNEITHNNTDDTHKFSELKVEEVIKEQLIEKVEEKPIVNEKVEEISNKNVTVVNNDDSDDSEEVLIKNEETKESNEYVDINLDEMSENEKSNFLFSLANKRYEKIDDDNNENIIIHNDLDDKDIKHEEMSSREKKKYLFDVLKEDKINNDISEYVESKTDKSNELTDSKECEEEFVEKSKKIKKEKVKKEKPVKEPKEKFSLFGRKKKNDDSNDDDDWGPIK